MGVSVGVGVVGSAEPVSVGPVKAVAVCLVVAPMSEVASGGASVGGGDQVELSTEDCQERGGPPVVEGRAERGESGNF